MTAPDPLQECLLGLHAALGESVPLIIAGGYGLYLKQRSIVQSGLRTLFSPDLLPDNRTTSDIDLFLRAEVVVSAARMKLVRDAVDGLGFAAVPQPFTYLLMKLLAFRDRCHDARKDMARHHAMDVYRIIAMITPEEDAVVRALAATHLDHPKAVEARRVVGEHFAAPGSLGILRLREHQLFFGRMDLNRFREVVRDPSAVRHVRPAIIRTALSLRTHHGERSPRRPGRRSIAVGSPDRSRDTTVRSSE